MIYVTVTISTCDCHILFQIMYLKDILLLKVVQKICHISCIFATLD